MAKANASRSFDLSNAEVKALAEQYAKDKKFPNPYRAGAYRFAIDALASLGVNKPHPLAKVHEAFRKAAGDEWYGEWAKKESRNDKTGKDADGRFLQNLKVLQRTKDYGRKLLQVGRRILKTKGCVIDLSRDGKGELLVRLNTNSPTPQKPGKAAQQSPPTAARKPRKPSGAANSKGTAAKPSPAPKASQKATAAK